MDGWRGGPSVLDKVQKWVLQKDLLGEVTPLFMGVEVSERENNVIYGIKYRY